MNNAGGNDEDGGRWTQWRENIIGLGEQSSRKSYYPELQRRLIELKRSEAKLRAIFNSTHDAIFIHDFDGRIEETNDPMLALYRVTRDQAQEYTLADYSAPGLQQEKLPRLLDELRRNGQDLLFEWQARRPIDGSEFAVEVALRPAFWSGHEAIVAVVRDISERKHAEQERRRLEQELAQLQRLESIGRLAGGMAHDFNNLLTPILSYAALLRDELPEGHEHRTDLGEIVHAAERARDLVRQLLAYARRQTFALRPLDLNETIRGFELLLRRVLRENIVLQLELAPEPVVINGDVGQIEQALMNLILNAQDAMPEGGRLALCTAALPRGGTIPLLPPGPLSLLRVSDTGIGMDEATKSRIFEPFFTTKPAGKGTGLGLASAYGIVSQHGGQIVVTSAPGRGTAFELFFPRHEAATPLTDARDDNTSKAPTPRGTATILVAEDQEQVRGLIARILERLGYRLLLASSGEEALRQADALTTTLDLLITDIVLPGLNGRELYRQLQQDRPGLQVLFISGYEAALVDAGTDVLPKPFRPDELVARVRSILGN